MSEFTKGTWEAGIDPIAVIPYVYVWTKLKQQKNKPAIIAVMHRCPYIKDKEQLANARLIAAAPEMYEMMKNTSNYILECAKLYSPFPDELCMYAERTKELIARIDGEVDNINAKNKS